MGGIEYNIFLFCFMRMMREVLYSRNMMCYFELYAMPSTYCITVKVLVISVVVGKDH